MSNHYHLVLRLDTEKARALSEDEVIARYGRLFKIPVLIERYLDGLTTDAENARGIGLYYAACSFFS